MTTGAIILISILILLCGYIFYSSYISSLLGVDPDNITPSHKLYDGIDYVPAKMPVLLGHHFSSIAGAAPIIGPIAATTFGWAPVLTWILIGSIFIGGVHDFASMIVSARHEGKSIGQVIKLHLGKTGHRLFLIFSIATLILIIAVFTILVAKTFVTSPESATASVLFIILAVFFGFSVYKIKINLVKASIVGVSLMFAAIYFGLNHPATIYLNSPELSNITKARIISSQKNGADFSSPSSALKNIETTSQSTKEIKSAEKWAFNQWTYLLLIYIFIASVTPVWILLQPRDYLSSYLLYFLIAGSLAGLIFCSTTGKIAIKMPAFTSFSPADGLYMFPFLFVIIACGAISGFHSLVASGTTSKQLDNEKDARVIGYGGMLIEALLAIIALITAITLTTRQYSIAQANPVALFASGAGNFIHSLSVWTGMIISEKAAESFILLAVSAFALTSLDTATRLARFSIQELFESFVQKTQNTDVKNNLSKYASMMISTGIAVGFAGILALSGKWQLIWPIFGAANQMLASLTLLAVSLWLYKQGKSTLPAIIPMIFMMLVTITALILTIKTNIYTNNIIVIIASLLLALALFLIIESFKSLKRGSTTLK